MHKRRDFAEAVQWVNTHGTHHPFSFDSVCDTLGIEAGLLRSRLRVLTGRPANSAGRGTWTILRLTELSRGQHMTPNRSPRRKHVRGNHKSHDLSTLGSTSVERHAAPPDEVLDSRLLPRVPVTERVCAGEEQQAVDLD